ncbi:septum formation family protein [Cellulomonas septica]|uniref:Septum formation-related domain-containing protein n=1 Tax=Cellulomonas septica TaxID=285080 RepID=A0ABX1K5H5_9CELL|nr:hypothetical protein [Cellulomonas septica]
MLPTRRVATSVAAPALLLLALSGCALLGPEEAPRESPGGQITESADADVFSVQVGDCINVSGMEEDTEMESLPVVPCTDPHDGEIYAETELPEGDFPGDAEVQAQGEEFCAAEFETFVGIPYDDSALYLWPLTPTQAGWDGVDDRVVQCVLDTDGELVTGTLKGAAR